MRSALASFCVSFITLSSTWWTVFTVCGHILILRHTNPSQLQLSLSWCFSLSDVFLEMLFMCLFKHSAIITRFFFILLFCWFALSTKSFVTKVNISKHFDLFEFLYSRKNSADYFFFFRSVCLYCNWQFLKSSEARGNFKSVCPPTLHCVCWASVFCNFLAGLKALYMIL